MAAEAANLAEFGPLAAGRTIRVHLIHGFELERDGQPVTISPGLQRLIAYLALHLRPMLRTHVAGALWLDASEQHAIANLRSTLCRLRQIGGRVIDASTTHLHLSSGVTVDLRSAVSLIHDVTDGSEVIPAPGPSIELLSGDVLPDWYDDWVLIERERYRQLRLRALEAMCERMTRASRFTQAIECGLAAVGAEPLRDSAQRVLIKAYLAEGNVADAMRQFAIHRTQLREELGMEPSDELARLIGRRPDADGDGHTMTSRSGNGTVTGSRQARPDGGFERVRGRR